MKLRPVFAALRFQEPRLEGLAALDEETLTLCDRSQLALPLARASIGEVPDAARARLERNVADNTIRTALVCSAFEEIARALAADEIPYLHLKGSTQFPDYCPDLNYRAQYDLDFYMPDGAPSRAAETMARLGYEPLGGPERPTDHLPTMLRRKAWTWSGNYYDPAIPVCVDLHFRFWDQATERFSAPGIEQFWERRAGCRLHRADALAYNCLHALRHLLRGSLRFGHIYDIAYFLHHRTSDDRFWREWRAIHPGGLRRLEALAFRFAEVWFGCRLASEAKEEIADLPQDVHAWFDEYAWSPVDAVERPNKHELWLHLSLLKSRTDALRVLQRRLLPGRLPSPAEPSPGPGEKPSLGARAGRQWRYAVHVASRFRHHARSLPPVVSGGLAWAVRSISPGRHFWTFLSSSALFNFGIFLFLLIYNLYLLDLGFREDFLGISGGVMMAGSIAGSLPAGWLVSRVGLRPTLTGGFLALASINALRSVVLTPAILLGLSFLAGVSLSIWAVAAAPAVAQLSAEQRRARAFSLFFSVGIATGILGGLIGGYLPGWLRGAGIGGGAVAEKRAALLASCVLCGLAAASIRSIPFARGASRQPMRYPSGRFIRRFLLAIGVWSLGTGLFHPFFNAYFARNVGAGIEEIGIVFSLSQVAQVLMLLAAPAALRALGLIAGVAAMQMLTGAALFALALTAGVPAAAVAYMAFRAFQYMSEPGLFSLLMDHAAVEEKGGASSLNFLVVFGAQALASVAAGAVIPRLGYPPVLIAAGAITIVSGWLFRALLQPVAGDSGRV